MSRLVDFYRGLGTDIEGRLLEDILAWNDDELEEVHDFIQWLFPLPEPSQYNPDAPLLTKEDIAAFKSDPVLQANLMRSFERILAFLGLCVVRGEGCCRRQLHVSACGRMDQPKPQLASHLTGIAEPDAAGNGESGRCSFRPPGRHVHEQAVSHLGGYVSVLDGSSREISAFPRRRR